ncbi:MAG: Gfo/Idh/MocA family oxidoreductase [Actinomycetota bacterium]|nr:Gfo/Idh/MocA family oxidoreductase [Actinomycetota bacterium]
MAVVGLGYWGPNLARNLQDLPEAELVWMCDLRPEVLEPYQQRYPMAKTTTELSQVLEDRSVEAIVIATPVSTHYSLVEMALRAGKHVFVEKPLAGSSAEGVRLIRLASELGLVLMPGHTFIYSPPVVKVRDLIASGELGEIYFVSMSRVNLGIHQADVSVAWDLGPHDFSILCYWLGEIPTRVLATSRCCIIPSIPDVAFVNLNFQSGVVAHCELSWLAPTKLRRTVVVGSRKMVVYDDTSTDQVRISDSGIDLPDPESFGEHQLSYRTGDVVVPYIGTTEPLALELKDFCSAVRTGATPRSSALMGLRIVEIVEAVERSLALDGEPSAVELANLDDLVGTLGDHPAFSSRRC